MEIQKAEPQTKFWSLQLLRAHFGVCDTYSTVRVQYEILVEQIQ